jgi:hypothetical protein
MSFHVVFIVSYKLAASTLMHVVCVVALSARNFGLTSNLFSVKILARSYQRRGGRTLNGPSTPGRKYSEANLNQ